VVTGRRRLACNRLADATAATCYEEDRFVHAGSIARERGEIFNQRAVILACA
jgi:hypothetical protein